MPADRSPHTVQQAGSIVLVKSDAELCNGLYTPSAWNWFAAVQFSLAAKRPAAELSAAPVAPPFVLPNPFH